MAYERTCPDACERFIDMVRIMYLAACAHKDVKADPTVIGAHKAMEMGTIDGAKALMLDHEIGSLETGKLADIVIADAGSMEWQPRGKSGHSASVARPREARRIAARGQQVAPRGFLVSQSSLRRRSAADRGQHRQAGLAAAVRSRKALSICHVLG